MVNLLGSEDGWSDAGVSVARLIPLPGDTFSELTLQVFRGKTSGLFDAPSRGDLCYVAQYRAYRDFGDDHNVELGSTWGHGLQRHDGGREDDARERRTSSTGGSRSADDRIAPSFCAASSIAAAASSRAGRRPPAASTSRRLPARQRGLRGPATSSPTGRTTRTTPRQRRGADAHFLAERVLPGSRRAPTATLRGRKSPPTRRSFNCNSRSAPTAPIPSEVPRS